MRPGFLVVLVSLFASGCATPAAQPSAGVGYIGTPITDFPDLERRVLRAVNDARRAEGRAPLAPDSSLTAIARAHSRDMRDRRFVAHRNPDGHAPGERALRAGYGFLHFGENLFRGRLYETWSVSRRGPRTHTAYHWYDPDRLAAFIAASWMESATHRENMLAEHFDFGGVGVGVGADYDVFVTINLSAR